MADDIYMYPIAPSWGNEYMVSWYKKLFNKSDVVISCCGDSTTLSSNVDNDLKRSGVIKNIIVKAGGYTGNVTSINNGSGGTTSTDFVEAQMASIMTQNPDLIVWMHGINDMTSSSGTLAERLKIYEDNIIEFLERLRRPTTETYNGRSCYGKTLDDTCVILCVPIVTRIGVTNQADGWVDGCRDVVKRMCRRYKCGYYDCGFYTTDNGYVSNWSDDSVHPYGESIVSFMSGIQTLIMPFGLWNLT